MSTNQSPIRGLTDAEVLASRDKHGANVIDYQEKNGLWEVIKGLAKEPMVILLLITAAIYFFSGDVEDAVFMAVAIVFVATISIYQDARTRNALEKLKSITQPNCKVIRNGETIEIPTAELVIGDAMVVEEGTSVPADGIILQANDFSVNESLLTGESLPVYKDASVQSPVFQGTTVASGLAIAQVNAIGKETQLGKIGKQLESISEEATPLERQINHFVRMMVIAGTAVFAFVWLLNWFRSGLVVDSLLKALTLAMSILPEEIPVAFTTFMALGAWRLMKKGILIKQIKTVETLGSANVICIDKTGTITENRMQLVQVVPGDSLSKEDVVRMAMWASEPVPFDPMETALHEAYAAAASVDERQYFRIIHEYPLDGKPPMMTHVFANSEGKRIIAAKGAPEAILALSVLTREEKSAIEQQVQTLAAEGYRILAVGEALFKGDVFPPRQQDFQLQYYGLVAFYDPPKSNMRTVLQDFYRAGISVKIITGDNALTTQSIAREIGFAGAAGSISGEALMALSEAELRQTVQATNIFTRMFPEAKLRIINALKANQNIVAMTGDGVNDAPALKAAHIGIAMGKKGTEIARQAASLILVADDLSKMVEAVAMGRRIYTNLKKAIQYIISIHIPIILTVFLPLVLNWIYPHIFSPVHIIFFELIMGPTCSIIYENEPMEAYAMEQPPRPFSTTFFRWKELITSIIQGLFITAGTLTAYQVAVHQGADEMLTRTMVFATLISANIFLTLVNRSFRYSVLHTLRYANPLIPLIIGITTALSAMFIYWQPVAHFFGFRPLNLAEAGTSIAIGFVSVIWYEAVKKLKQ
ncbi:cation-translocating P-type ATPase [Rhodoflexus caldus]|uniref:cation-translocating P-type ATPase n=1 Tax=Rhodoflexus caldus TaxID=2891236 RepID=UPI00202A5744|nr:cation-translocating P-type ATPase [Rhodoflexus caldus]